MFQSRKDISLFIQRVENQFNVNEWKFNGIHFWPLIRLELFFHLIRFEKNEKSEILKKKDVIPVQKTHSRPSLLKAVIKLFKYYFELPKRDFVFVGSDVHRITIKNKRFNRFFDPIISKLNIKENTLYLEYGKLNSTTYHNAKCVISTYSSQKTFIFVASFLKRFLKKKMNFQFNDYQNFLDFLSEEERTKIFANKFSIKYLKEDYFETFWIRYLFFKVVLKKINPKKIFILCFYDFQNLSLIAAANDLKINTVDFQHGPQPSVHLAYSEWNNIPKKGYKVLPKQFWNWDTASSNNIEKWASVTKQYSSFIGGNTWVTHWNDNKQQYEFKDFILYSLQPDPLNLSELFCDNIIKAIKHNKFVWFIRLHPRQLERLEEFKAIISKEGLVEKVNFENASFDPLPQLLKNALIHVTHYSGTALEASMMGKHSVLLHKNALFYFPELIENKNATFIDYNDDSFQETFLKLVQNIMNAKQEKNTYQSIDYSNFFKC